MAFLELRNPTRRHPRMRKKKFFSLSSTRELDRWGRRKIGLWLLFVNLPFFVANIGKMSRGRGSKKFNIKFGSRDAIKIGKVTESLKDFLTRNSVFCQSTRSLSTFCGSLFLLFYTNYKTIRPKFLKQILQKNIFFIAYCRKIFFFIAEYKKI